MTSHSEFSSLIDAYLAILITPVLLQCDPNNPVDIVVIVVPACS
jgi:hypothetical protein